MGILMRLALRNLWRNKIRTAITLVAISGGLAMLMFGNNLNHGTYIEMIRTGISQLAGHVVVQGDGWQEDNDPLEYRVANADSVAARLAEAWPDSVVVQRTYMGGLLSSTSNSTGVAITAIQPVEEAKVSDWHTKMVEGEWLEPGDDRGIVLGVKLAETLEVDIGDKVVLMGQGKEDVSSRLFRVRALTRTGSDQVDGFTAIVEISAAQAFLEDPGSCSQVSLHLKNPLQSDDALAAVLEAFPDPEQEGLEVLGWKKAVEAIYQLTVTDRRTNNSMMFIIGLIVALGILNTMLMGVMERMKEFGVMLALGTPPGRLRKLITLEGLLIGLIGTAIGLALGSWVTAYLVENGIDYSAMMGEQMDMGGVSISTQIYAAWDYTTMTVYCIVAVLLSVAATIYPAWKAGAMKPVESMRHV